jgi:hypothetical protein
MPDPAKSKKRRGKPLSTRFSLESDRAAGTPDYAVSYTTTIPEKTFSSTEARGLRRGGYIRQGNVWVPTLPSTGARDYSQPAYLTAQSRFDPELATLVITETERSP